MAEEDHSEMAPYMCQKFILEQLKAPATADFQSARESAVNRTADSAQGEMFTVETYVDAQNSFGANIRTRFRCEVARNKKTDQWVLVSLNRP